MLGVYVERIKHIGRHGSPSCHLTLLMLYLICRYHNVAIKAYIKCSATVYANRAMLTVAEMLTSRGQYKDASTFFMRMTSEESVYHSFPFRQCMSDGREAHTLASPGGVHLKFKHRAPFVKMACKQNLDLRCVLISDPGTLGAGAKTRLHNPKAVTYHEQPHYCRFMIGHSLGRVESRIKKFTPHCICRAPFTQWCHNLHWRRVSLSDLNWRGVSLSDPSNDGCWGQNTSRIQNKQNASRIQNKQNTSRIQNRQNSSRIQNKPDERMNNIYNRIRNKPDELPFDYKYY